MRKIIGYNDWVSGPAMIWHNNEQVDVLVYDAESIRNRLVAEGMSREEAREYIESNIENAYMGPDTPLLVWTEDLWL